MLKSKLCARHGEASARGDFFCGHCGALTTLPWRDADGAAIDGLSCLEATFIDDASGVSCTLNLQCDCTTKMGEHIARTFRESANAKPELTVEAVCNKAKAATTWDSTSNTMRLRWQGPECPPRNAVFPVDLTVRLNLDVFNRSNRLVIANRERPVAVSTRLRLYAQSAQRLTIASSDPRWIASADNSSAPYFWQIVSPKPIDCDFSFQIGLIGTPALRPGTTLYASTLDGSPLTELRTVFANDKLFGVLSARQLNTLLPNLRADETRTLRIIAARDDGELEGSCRLPVRAISLGVSTPENLIRCAFSETESWVAQGKNIDARVMRIGSEKDWERFDVLIAPCGDLAKYITIHQPKAGGIRARMLLSHAFRGLPAPVVGDAALVLVRKGSLSPDGSGSFTGDAPVLGRMRMELSTELRAPCETLAVDFGTSNTAAALLERLGQSADDSVRDGEAIELEQTTQGAQGPTEMHSAIFYGYGPADGEIDLSRSAIGYYAQLFHQRNSSDASYRTGMKSLLLQDIAAGRSTEFAIHVNTLAGTGERKKSSTQLCEDYLFLFLQKVFTSRAVDGRAVRKLVFTYPVRSSYKYREALKVIYLNALKRLGHPMTIADDDSEVIVEPAHDEATCGGLKWFECNLYSTLEDNESLNLLIYDYGGGTTDICLLNFMRLGEAIEARILGISGQQEAGGDDVTWRIEREFVLTRLNRNDAVHSELGLLARNKKSSRAQWRMENPWLFHFVDTKKTSVIGVGVPESKDNKEFAELKGAASAWTDLDVPLAKGTRTTDGRQCVFPIGSNDACTLGADGRYAKADDHSRTDDALKHAPLMGHFAVDLGAASACNEQTVLHEARQALGIAKRLIKRVLGEDKKVDKLLVIGQACQTRYFESELLNQLKDCAKETYVSRREADSDFDPKTCVVQGACVAQKILIALRSTILQPIMYRAGRNHLTLLSSGWDCNAAHEIDANVAAVLQSSGLDPAMLFVDAEYTGVLVDARRFKELKKKGGWHAPGKLLALVSDGDGLPPDLRTELDAARAEKPRPGNSEDRLLFIWPEGRPEAAAIFSFAF